MVILQIYTDDITIDIVDDATIIVSDYNGMLPPLGKCWNHLIYVGGNSLDPILRYHYGYPKVQPLSVIAYFQARYDLKLEMCKLWVGGKYSEKNCEFEGNKNDAVYNTVNQ